MVSDVINNDNTKELSDDRIIFFVKVKKVFD